VQHFIVDVPVQHLALKQKKEKIFQIKFQMKRPMYFFNNLRFSSEGLKTNWSAQLKI